jgi:hypothetical protein
MPPLVLVATRELAARVADTVRCYGKFLPFRAAAVHDGVSINTTALPSIADIGIVLTQRAANDCGFNRSPQHIHKTSLPENNNPESSWDGRLVV